MAEELQFTVAEGQTIARETLVANLNTGTREEPVWSPVGIRVYSSSIAYDWQRETSQDITGNIYSTMKKPVITQPFDPWELSGGDMAQIKIWNEGIRKQDPQAMSNQDMLIVHKYVYVSGQTNWFAERYQACAVEINGLGGDGGGNIGMPINVTYGGVRTTGTVTTQGGKFVFVPDEEAL